MNRKMKRLIADLISILVVLIVAVIALAATNQEGLIWIFLAAAVLAAAYRIYLVIPKH